MARETRETWAKRVERWRDSGLTAMEFAAETGINPRTLKFWSWRLATDERAKDGRREAKQKSSPVEWMEVTPATVSAPRTTSAPRAIVVPAAATSVPAPLEVVCGRATVRVPADFDATTLGRLLDVLEAR